MTGVKIEYLRREVPVTVSECTKEITELFVKGFYFQNPCKMDNRSLDLSLVETSSKTTVPFS